MELKKQHNLHMNNSVHKATIKTQDIILPLIQYPVSERESRAAGPSRNHEIC